MTNEAEYYQDEDIDPITNAAINHDKEERRFAVFDMTLVVEVHCKEFMQRELPAQPQHSDATGRLQGTAAASITGCRPQKEVTYIIYVLLQWDDSVKIQDMTPGPEKGKFVDFWLQWSEECSEMHSQTNSGTWLGA